MHAPQAGDGREASEGPDAGCRASKPSRTALLLALVPFAAMCFSVPLWDRVHPMILGLPFNLSWLIAWIVLTSACMAAGYRKERGRR
jgi:Protein of unknown function (DUF3311)